MTCVNFKRIDRFALWLVALAYLFITLSPILNAWRAQSQPQLYSELCTRFGLVKVPLAGDDTPRQSDSHAPECALCVPSGTWLAVVSSASLTVPSPAGRNPAPVFSPGHHAPSAARTQAQARAPPAYS